MNGIDQYPAITEAPRYLIHADGRTYALVAFEWWTGDFAASAYPLPVYRTTCSDCGVEFVTAGESKFRRQDGIGWRRRCDHCVAARPQINEAERSRRKEERSAQQQHKAAEKARRDRERAENGGRTLAQIESDKKWAAAVAAARKARRKSGHRRRVKGSHNR